MAGEKRKEYDHEAIRVEYFAGVEGGKWANLRQFWVANPGRWDYTCLGRIAKKKNWFGLPPEASEPTPQEPQPMSQLEQQGLHMKRIRDLTDKAIGSLEKVMEKKTNDPMDIKRCLDALQQAQVVAKENSKVLESQGDRAKLVVEIICYDPPHPKPTETGDSRPKNIGDEGLADRGLVRPISTRRTGTGPVSGAECGPRGEENGVRPKLFPIGNLKVPIPGGRLVLGAESKISTGNGLGPSHNESEGTAKEHTEGGPEQG